MATHRDTGLAPAFEFRVAMDVLDASQDLAARHLPVTPRALARRLSARPAGPRPTLAQIRDALAQVRLWRDQILTGDLLRHRRQLVALLARAEEEQRRSGEDRAYLTVMLLEADTLLHNTLTAAGARRAPQWQTGPGATIERGRDRAGGLPTGGLTTILRRSPHSNARSRTTMI